MKTFIQLSSLFITLMAASFFGQAIGVSDGAPTTTELFLAAICLLLANIYFLLKYWIFYVAKS
jgi:hypothetical protein